MTVATPLRQAEEKASINRYTEINARRIVATWPEKEPWNYIDWPVSRIETRYGCTWEVAMRVWELMSEKEQ